MPHSSFGLEWPEPCLSSIVGFWRHGWLSFREALGACPSAMMTLTPEVSFLLRPLRSGPCTHSVHIWLVSHPSISSGMQPWISFEVISAHRETSAAYSSCPAWIAPYLTDNFVEHGWILSVQPGCCLDLSEPQFWATKVIIYLSVGFSMYLLCFVLGHRSCKCPFCGSEVSRICYAFVSSFSQFTNITCLK